MKYWTLIIIGLYSFVGFLQFVSTFAPIEYKCKYNTLFRVTNPGYILGCELSKPRDFLND